MVCVTLTALGSTLCPRLCGTTYTAPGTRFTRTLPSTTHPLVRLAAERARRRRRTGRATSRVARTIATGVVVVAVLGRRGRLRRNLGEHRSRVPGDILRHAPPVVRLELKLRGFHRVRFATGGVLGAFALRRERTIRRSGRVVVAHRFLREPD